MEDPPGTPPAGNPAGDPPADPPAGGTPLADPPAPPTPNVWDDPVAAKAEIEKLRKENGDERINAKKQAADEARQELLTKLGLTKDGDSKPDPDALARQISAKDEALRTLTVERALDKA